MFKRFRRAPVDTGPDYQSISDGEGITESGGTQFNRDDVRNIADTLTYILVRIGQGTPDALDSLLVTAAFLVYIKGIEEEVKQYKPDSGAIFGLGVQAGYHLATLGVALGVADGETMASIVGMDDEDCGDPNCPVHGVNKAADDKKEILH